MMKTVVKRLLRGSFLHFSHDTLIVLHNSLYYVKLCKKEKEEMEKGKEERRKE